MVTEISPSARMQLVNIGELLHPAACMVCGNGTSQDGYLRLGVYFDYEGECYLCVRCLTEAGETIGMLTSDEAEHLTGLSAATSTDLADAKEKLEAANERLNHYDTLFGDRIHSSGSNVIAESAGKPKAERENARATGRTVKLADIGESIPTEPVEDSRSSQPSLFERGDEGIQL